MLQPIQVPLDPAGDKIAGVLARLTAPGQTMLLTTLATRRFGGVDAIVLFHFNDGSREWLLADESRAMAERIRDTGERTDWADNLDDAAETADRMASAVLLAVRAPDGVGSARAFGGRR